MPPRNRLLGCLQGRLVEEVFHAVELGRQHAGRLQQRAVDSITIVADMHGRGLRAAGPQHLQFAAGRIPALADRLGLDLRESAGADPRMAAMRLVSASGRRADRRPRSGPASAAWTGAAARCGAVAGGRRGVSVAWAVTVAEVVTTVSAMLVFSCERCVAAAATWALVWPSAPKSTKLISPSVDLRTTFTGPKNSRPLTKTFWFSLTNSNSSTLRRSTPARESHSGPRRRSPSRPPCRATPRRRP